MTAQQSSGVETKTIYSAVSANRHENNISCSKNYLLYSRCNCPVIYNTRTKQVASLLLGHTGEVNGECFIAAEEAAQEISETCYILSTSHDKTAIIWKVEDDARTTTTTTTSKHGNSIKHSILYSFKSPDGEIFTSRCSLRKANQQFVTVTTTLAGTIYLHLNDQLVHTLKTNYYSFNCKLHTIRKSHDNSAINLIFLAGSDNKVHVFHLLDSTLEPLFELSGHSDWIKCIDTLHLACKPLEFLLASASQDSYIRVWHMKLVDYDIDSSQVRTTVSKPLLLTASPLEPKSSLRLTATLETVLLGHENIVHSLCWFKKRLSDPLALQLISCSADKTIFIWNSTLAPMDSDQSTTERRQLNRYEQSPASADVWKQSQKLGETGETNLPFLAVCLADDDEQADQTFYSLSLRGAIHSWTWSVQDNCWKAGQSITGHSEPVTDLSWEKSGAYLLSSSLDKTCRLHAQARSSCDRWHELARPQVHGHEINCLASLSFAKFISGAEEKTIRAYEGTQFFLKNYEHLSGDIPNETKQSFEGFPLHAQLPALGLSNRGATEPYDIEEPSEKSVAGTSSNTWYEVSKLVEQLAQMDHLGDFPIEEVLLQSTLWWETNKLFGHSNELHALAVDSTGQYLASASKANRSDLASVIIWECSQFRKSATIDHHSLTVTRLKFSPNDKYLLSVSRDRTWCLSERTGKPRPAYKKLIGTTKSSAIHERIIWDCCWTHDSKYFMTVSRDKKAILWSTDKLLESSLSSSGDDQQASTSMGCVTSNVYASSIQAVDSLNFVINSVASAKSYLFALGFEDGSLELCRVSADQWQTLKTFEHFHHLPIRRLAFRPSPSSSSDSSELTYTTAPSVMLASAGDDCIVKLTKFTLF